MYIREIDEGTGILINTAKILLTLLIIYYFWYNEVFSHNSFIVYTCFMGALICIGIQIISDGESPFNNTPLTIKSSIVLLAYSLFIGFLVAFNVKALVYDWIMILKYTAIAFMICYVSSRINDIEWVLRTLVLTSIISSIQLIVNGYQAYTYRISLSSHNNPNALGIMISMGLFSTVYLCKKKAKDIAFSLALVTLFLYSIIKTGSRKSVIFAIAMIVLWMITYLKWVYDSNSLGLKVFATVLIIIFLLVVLKYYRDYFLNSNLHERLNLFEEEDSNGNRIRHYLLAWNIFKKKPLFGGGLLQFAYWSGAGTYAHSTYAEAIADFGLIGSLLYFIPLIITSYKALKKSIGLSSATHKNRIVFFLVCGEIFWAFVTILFSEVYHYVGLAIISWLVENSIADNTASPSKRRGKYVKN